MTNEKKRDKLKIIYDMLNVIKEKGGKIKPTHLMYKANLSHIMMKDYLKELFTMRFITEQVVKTNSYYIITERGLAFLNKYQSIVNFVESFGLDE